MTEDPRDHHQVDRGEPVVRRAEGGVAGDDLETGQAGLRGPAARERGVGGVELDQPATHVALARMVLERADELTPLTSADAQDGHRASRCLGADRGDVPADPHHAPDQLGARVLVGVVPVAPLADALPGDLVAVDFVVHRPWSHVATVLEFRARSRARTPTIHLRVSTGDLGVTVPTRAKCAALRVAWAFRRVGRGDGQREPGDLSVVAGGSGRPCPPRGAVRRADLEAHRGRVHPGRPSDRGNARNGCSAQLDACPRSGRRRVVPLLDRHDRGGDPGSVRGVAPEHRDPRLGPADRDPTRVVPDDAGRRHAQARTRRRNDQGPDGQSVSSGERRNPRGTPGRHRWPPARRSHTRRRSSGAPPAPCRPRLT